MEIETTQRGFGIANFKDRYNQECSIQDSSLATEPAIWLGVDNTGESMGNKEGQRMHLTINQVKELLPLLQYFVATGDYIRDYKEQDNGRLGRSD